MPGLRARAEIPQALSCGVPSVQACSSTSKKVHNSLHNIGSKDRMACHLVTPEKSQFDISDSLGCTEMEFGMLADNFSRKHTVTNLRDAVFSGACLRHSKCIAIGMKQAIWRTDSLS